MDILAEKHITPWIDGKTGKITPECEQCQSQTSKAVASEIKRKLYHPPIFWEPDIKVDSKELVKIMLKVREYYQIVFDEATGIEG